MNDNLIGGILTAKEFAEVLGNRDNRLRYEKIRLNKRQSEMLCNGISAIQLERDRLWQQINDANSVIGCIVSRSDQIPDSTLICVDLARDYQKMYR